MNLADFLKKSVFALSVGAGAGILFQAAAFLTPMYYVNLYMILALLLAELSVFAVMLGKRTTMEQAALTIDGFGFEERIATAYENLDKEGTFIGLQRKDAMQQLRAHKDRIQIPLWPSFKKNVLFFSLLALLFGLSLIPSPVKERAGELHGIKEEAQEKEDEIEKVIEDLEQLEQEELTKEQQEALREMAESLESSLTEYQQAYSEEALAAASQKLDYKYEDMSAGLSKIIEELQSGAGVSIASTDAMQEMAERLKKKSKEKLAQGNGAQTGQGEAGGDAKEGQGDGSGNGQSGANDHGGQNGQDGQNGQNGQNGQGQGGGSGDGRGYGSSSTPHDYVSVPNEIADSENLTGTVGNHDASDYFRAQNGLNWEGEHTSYEAVIGSYEQNAYEGIAAKRYPGGMEGIIKEYFAGFNN